MIAHSHRPGVTASEGLAASLGPCASSPIRSRYGRWCGVSFLLSENGFIREELNMEAEIYEAINDALDMSAQHDRHPRLVDEVNKALRVS